jgi:hypothetical protein
LGAPQTKAVVVPDAVDEGKILKAAGASKEILLFNFLHYDIPGVREVGTVEREDR